MQNEAVAATLDAAKVFHQLNIPYFVGGSLATAIHGVARATMDVDLVADAEMDAVFQKYPHWRQSGHQERDVLRELYGVLLRARAEAIKDGRTAKEVNEVATLVNQIIKLTRQTE